MKEECKHKTTKIVNTNDGVYFNACGSCSWKYRLTQKQAEEWENYETID